ncbi:MAG: thiolase family protein [Ignavibacteria bacterium]|nr:thiolase family protein [Ignavibacteria bacterium]
MRTEAYIVEAVRTPIGKYGGVFRDVRADDLGAIPLRALLSRTKISAECIDDVIIGCANQAGEDNRNIGRMCSLLAGFPYSVPGVTINRLCGSSLEAINIAARSIWSNEMDIVIAGGVESMSRAPYSIAKNQKGTFGNVTAYDTALGWRYPNPQMEKLFPLESMGETAENIAEKYKISREAQDEFAFRSHNNAVKAQEENVFSNELISVETFFRNTSATIISDECPRKDTTLEKLSQLSSVFKKNGTVTAGNSSTLNDGAAAVLIMNEKSIVEQNLSPIARIVSTGIAGVDPRYMGIGPVPATQQAMKKGKITIADLDIIELNEAFAAQSLAVIRELKLSIENVNVNGGAIALGHPLGCSGARILTTLVYELVRRKSTLGLATMCIGVGQGIATIVERV